MKKELILFLKIQPNADEPPAQKCAAADLPLCAANVELVFPNTLKESHRLSHFKRESSR
jgi:hypothetical protein